jgi:hypothetical protein
MKIFSPIGLAVVFIAITLPESAVGDSGCADALTPSRNPGELRAFVDPDTGELVTSAPAGEALDAPERQAGPEDYADVRFESRTSGEVAADVGNRFHRELRVEIVDGQAVTCHVALNRDSAQTGQAPE